MKIINFYVQKAPFFMKPLSKLLLVLILGYCFVLGCSRDCDEVTPNQDFRIGLDSLTGGRKICFLEGDNPFILSSSPSKDYVYELDTSARNLLPVYSYVPTIEPGHFRRFELEVFDDQQIILNTSFSNSFNNNAIEGMEAHVLDRNWDLISYSDLKDIYQGKRYMDLRRIGEGFLFMYASVDSVTCLTTYYLDRIDQNGIVSESSIVAIDSISDLSGRIDPLTGGAEVHLALFEGSSSCESGEFHMRVFLTSESVDQISIVEERTVPCFGDALVFYRYLEPIGHAFLFYSGISASGVININSTMEVGMSQDHYASAWYYNGAGAYPSMTTNKSNIIFAIDKTEFVQVGPNEQASAQFLSLIKIGGDPRQSEREWLEVEAPFGGIRDQIIHDKHVVLLGSKGLLYIDEDNLSINARVY